MKAFLSRLKNVKARQAIYPIITFVFAAIVILLFVSSARFFSAELNQVLTVDEKAVDVPLTKIDIADYAVVGRKLGIVIQEGTAAPPPPAPPEAPAPATSSSTSTAAVSAKSLKIQILNSTGVTGAATRLSASLKESGFSNVTTGNQPKEETVTLIRVKASEANIAAIGDLVAAMATTKYKAETSTLDEASPYDVVIVIGLR